MEEAITLDEVVRVTDQELITRLRGMVRSDHALNVRVLVHLGEVDARGLYRDEAYSSMFAYCVEELGMFEAQAYLRIQAARLSRRYPLILRMLAQGVLHLTAIKLLGPHLTAENHVELLERARGKSKREIELLVAEIAPKADVPGRIRRLPSPSAERVARSAPLSTPSAPLSTPSAERVARSAPLSALSAPLSTLPASSHKDASRGTTSLETAPATFALGFPGEGCVRGEITPAVVPGVCDPIAATSAECSTAARSLGARGSSTNSSAPNGPGFALEAPRPRGSSKPLSPGRYKVEFTAGQALRDKLEQLQDLLRHQVPDGDLAVIVERAVDVLIESTVKRRFAQTSAPNAQTSAPKAQTKPRSTKPRRVNSRYVPRAVVREVHRRDAGQCTFVSTEGKRCPERGFLELHHHERPFARGGEATVDNLRLVCRTHNALFADRDFGRSFMNSKRSQAGKARNQNAPDVPERVSGLISAKR